MNFVGILGPATDVLKTGGVGTCVVLAIHYRDGQDTPRYALAHVPYDTSILAGDPQNRVNGYVDEIFAFLGNPHRMSVRVLVNGKYKFTDEETQETVEGRSRLVVGIEKRLDADDRVLDRGVSIYGGPHAAPRMNVVILGAGSGHPGKLFCYTSNKLEFYDEGQGAQDSLLQHNSFIHYLEGKTRQEKHSFRRHIDLHRNARPTPRNGYDPKHNPYSKVLRESADKYFNPVKAEDTMFSRLKTEPWFKKRPAPGLVLNYLAWENRIRSRILGPPPADWGNV
ncbi:hypothetical protein MFUL124B02_26220 [Myxococcus fulvus 124B02]|nr:hypothetical protein MFUL124B02_26220 [Myxococcus fulvus 124B02]